VGHVGSLLVDDVTESDHSLRGFIPQSEAEGGNA
jgi:hypothetical protein